MPSRIATCTADARILSRLDNGALTPCTELCKAESGISRPRGGHTIPRVYRPVGTVTIPAGRLVVKSIRVTALNENFKAKWFIVLRDSWAPGRCPSGDVPSETA